MRNRTCAYGLIVALTLLLSACAVVYCPDCTVTVDDADTITVEGNEALAK